METAVLTEAINEILSALADMVADRVADKLAERERREESTKEENKENTSYNNINNNNNSNNNININNNTMSVDDDDVEAINKVNNYDCSSNNGIPTLKDIEDYVQKRGYKMSARKCYDYYKNLGWKTKTGASIIGAWKGYVDNWAKNEFQHQPEQKKVAGMGTVEERRATHKFVPTNFDEL